MEGKNTLNEWMEEWLDVYKVCKVKASTLDNYRYAVSLIQRYPVAEQPIDTIDERDLQKCLNKLFQSSYSKSTIFKVRLTLKQVFALARRQRKIPANPAEELVLPSASVKEICPLTHAEEAAVVAACKEDPLGHLMQFLLLTGLRREELKGLRWRDYICGNNDEPYIHIRKSKTPAGVRIVYLLPEAQEIIESQPRTNEFIFNSTRGTPLTNTVMRRLYERIREKTGIYHLTNHVCRHTFVTRLCERGASAKAIAQIIGHAHAQYVLDIYAKMEQQEQRRVIYVLKDQPKSA